MINADALQPNMLNSATPVHKELAETAFTVRWNRLMDTMGTPKPAELSAGDREEIELLTERIGLPMEGRTITDYMEVSDGPLIWRMYQLESAQLGRSHAQKVQTLRDQEAAEHGVLFVHTTDESGTDTTIALGINDHELSLLDAEKLKSLS